MALLELDAPPVDPPVELPVDAELDEEIAPLEEPPTDGEVVPLEEPPSDGELVPVLLEERPGDADAEPLDDPPAEAEDEGELLAAALLLPPLLPVEALPEPLLDPPPIDEVAPPSPGLVFDELHADSRAVTSAVRRSLFMMRSST